MKKELFTGPFGAPCHKQSTTLVPVSNMLEGFDFSVLDRGPRITRDSSEALQGAVVRARGTIRSRQILESHGVLLEPDGPLAIDGEKIDENNLSELEKYILDATPPRVDSFVDRMALHRRTSADLEEEANAMRGDFRFRETYEKLPWLVRGRGTVAVAATPEEIARRASDRAL